MCGRLACTLCAEDLRKACAYPKQKDGSYEYILPSFIESSTLTYTPRYNICPSLVVPILAHQNYVQDADSSVHSEFVILPVQWGLNIFTVCRYHYIHFYPSCFEHPCDRCAKVQSPGTKPYTLHNAQLEKPNRLAKNQHCVVLCDGYFEWQTVNAEKQPYYIYQEKNKVEDTVAVVDWIGEPILKLAGIFNSKKDSEGNTTYSCSVITKEADDRLSWLHHRMPVILESFEDVENWISHSKLNSNASIEFITKYAKNPEEHRKIYTIKYHPVSKQYVNNSSCRSEKCIEPLKLKRQNTLDSWVCKRPKTSKSSE